MLKIPYLSHKRLLAALPPEPDLPLLNPAVEPKPHDNPFEVLIETDLEIAPSEPNLGIIEEPAAEIVDSHTRALELLTDLAETHQQLARNLKQEGKLNEAIEHYRQAIELHKANAQGKLLPGSDEHIEEIETDTEIEAEIEPKEELPKISPPKTSPSPPRELSKAVQVYLQQAQGYYSSQEWDKVIEACQSALAVTPELVEAYKIWGNALQAQGDILGAMGLYGKALEIDPNSAAVHVNLGNLYAKQQQWQQAIDYYHQAIALDDQLGLVYRNLAKILTKIGKTEEALKYQYKGLSLEDEKTTAQEHFNLGQQLWQQGWVTEAITCYRRAISLDPDWIEAYEKLADGLIRQGQWQEGAMYAKKIYELREQSAQKTELQANSPAPNVPVSPLQVSTALQVAKTLNSRQIHENTEQLQAKQQKALEYYQRAAKENPESAEIQADLGSVYAQQQDWEQAIACYQKALSIDPNLARVYRNLAKVFTQVGREEEAVSCWYQALTLEPRAASAQKHYNLGNALLAQKSVTEAISCYFQAIKLQTDFLSAYYRLGELFLEQGHNQKALAIYHRAIKYNPHDGESYTRLGQLYTLEERTDDAIKAFRQAITLKTNNFSAYLGLGEILFKQEKWQQTIPYYQKAIALQPNLSLAHHNLGRAWLQLEKWEQATRMFRRAVKLQPDLFWSWHGLGKALLKQEKWEEAVIAFNQAIELNGDFPWNYYYLGEALCNLEKWDLALQNYLQCSQLKEDLPQIKQKLALVWENLNQSK